MSMEAVKPTPTPCRPTVPTVEPARRIAPTTLGCRGRPRHDRLRPIARLLRRGVGLIVSIIIVCTAGGVFLLWAVWWIYRGTPKHGKHHTTLPTVAAHHPVSRGPIIVPDAVYRDMVTDLSRDTEPSPPVRHTHRDPTTGRYTRKEQS